MCEKCDHIDEKLKQYERLRAAASERVMRKETCRLNPAGFSLSSTSDARHPLLAPAVRYAAGRRRSRRNRTFVANG